MIRPKIELKYKGHKPQSKLYSVYHGDTYGDIYCLSQ